MSEAATKPDIVVGVDGSDESFAALKWLSLIHISEPTRH